MSSRIATTGYCLFAGFLLLVSTAVQAVTTVNAPWVQPAPDRTSTGAYMSLTSTEGAILKEVRSTLATSVVIRAASGVKTFPRLSLPAGVTVTLSPDAFHLVLRGLAHPLAVGDRVPIVLTIEATNGSRQEISVNAEVRSHSPMDDERRAPRR